MGDGSMIAWGDGLEMLRSGRKAREREEGEIP